METEQFIRKPLVVDAVQVTKENIEQVSEWCGGEILTTKNPKTKQLDSYIQVPVNRPLHPRQTKAFPGDWVLVSDSGASFKIYTKRAFEACFDRAATSATPLFENSTDFDPIMA